MVINPAILDRIINPSQGDLSPEVAHFILSLDFPPADHARYAQLSETAQLGALTEQEAAELDDFLSVDAFLTILGAKARKSCPPSQLPK